MKIWMYDNNQVIRIIIDFIRSNYLSRVYECFELNVKNKNAKVMQNIFIGYCLEKYT